MEKELLSKGELKIKVEGAKVLLILDSAGVDFTVAVDGEYFMDKLAQAIPGQIDDTVIGLLKGALKG